LARAARTPAPRGKKGDGKKAPARQKSRPADVRLEDDDPYRELRVPEADEFAAPSDDYIWPEYEDDDEDRV
jgi:hypothetical protein